MECFLFKPGAGRGRLAMIAIPRSTRLHFPRVDFVDMSVKMCLPASTPPGSYVCFVDNLLACPDDRPA